MQWPPGKGCQRGQLAMMRDSLGCIRMGTGSEQTALVRFDPEKVKLPNMLLQRVSINEELILW